MPDPQLKLNGFKFQELFEANGLARLDQQFLNFLEQEDTVLCRELEVYRQAELLISPEGYSAFLIAIAAQLELFLLDLFGISEPASRLQAEILKQEPIFLFKNYFVSREAKRLLKQDHLMESFTELNCWLQTELSLRGLNTDELSVAQYAQSLLADMSTTAVNAKSRLIAWCAQALSSEEGKHFVQDWVSFTVPQKLSFEQLVRVEYVAQESLACLQGHPSEYRNRDGFELTDQRMSEREVLSEIDYCVYCHQNNGDFCSKGFPLKKSEPALGFKENPNGELLTGCPLEEKISEMHMLKKSGLSIAALAMVMLDNPLCPATGHRICNDCMKACIYQKQDPVNIPQIETRVLYDVLSLPWGVEIYDLLTRWNPLRQDQFVMQPYNGLKVLVMGMGPAGFTIAHHLTMAGCAVVGCDGLKMESLPTAYLSQPIYSYQALEESLADRSVLGFGGVAEYGITVRWDKNFLKLIYITLMRRPYFQVVDSLRFGGAVTVAEAWRLGFDHLVLAVGAGLPKELAIPNSLAPGMRQANDFLMALQLTGAAKESSLANLQVRLPAVVIGGGLTGVDTATEAQVYYIKQIEKLNFRYEQLASVLGETTLRAQFTRQDLVILDEFRAHAACVREERNQAMQEQRQPCFLPLIRAWGGVTIVYRRSIQESPAYKRNPEELQKAFEEGIYYAEHLEPQSVLLDLDGQCQSLQCISHLTPEPVILPARSIFVATGAQPNVAYGFEHKDDIARKKFQYLRYREEDGALLPVNEVGHVKMPECGVFTSYEKDHHFVSFIGDTHPIFHGSVVKAVASAKYAYPRILKAMRLDEKKAYSEAAKVDYPVFHQHIENLFRAHIVRMKELSSQATLLTIRAPQVARMFQPGQFCRLQRYERFTGIATESVAALGFKMDSDDHDCLSFLIFKEGVSSAILVQATVGEPISLMGPTGVRTAIANNPRHVLFIGNHLAIPYALSVAPALKAAGGFVSFVLVTPAQVDGALLEKVVDNLIIATEIGQAHEVPDLITESLLAVLDEVHVIGSVDLLRAIQTARHTTWQTHLKPTISFKGSVYGPMQCMLKGVCAQCLQWQIDPETGMRTKAVYACSWQHQPMELIDMNHLQERLSQNSMQEQLTRLWYNYFGEAQ